MYWISCLWKSKLRNNEQISVDPLHLLHEFDYIQVTFYIVNFILKTIRFPWPSYISQNKYKMIKYNFRSIPHWRAELFQTSIISDNVWSLRSTIHPLLTITPVSCNLHNAPTYKAFTEKVNRSKMWMIVEKQRLLSEPNTTHSEASNK